MVAVSYSVSDQKSGFGCQVLKDVFNLFWVLLCFFFNKTETVNSFKKSMAPASICTQIYYPGK